ncbi:MAG: hypothetical protein SGJ00_06430 [bacterium]|nr:hypothetical protein [bacterium]
MKKLLLLGAFVAFGFLGVNAQTAVAAPSSDVVSAYQGASDDKPAKAEKKSRKDKKACKDEKSKSCASGEKKACCSSKHGSTTETPAKETK